MKLDNHRQLKPNEIIRKGDLYTARGSSQVKSVKHSIGQEVSECFFYNVFRRKHTAKTVTIRIPKSGVVNTSNTPKNVPHVTFTYWKNSYSAADSKFHNVRLISMNSDYLTGLDIQFKDGKATYKFKKFLRSRASGITLTSYQPVE